MLKKSLLTLASAALIAGLTACSSVNTGTTLHGMKLSDNENDTTIAHMNGNIWGIYFFHVLPVLSGSYSTSGSCAAFKDTVKVDHAVNLLTKNAVNIGATKVIDMQSSTSTLPLLIFSVKEVQISGNAVK